MEKVNSTVVKLFLVLPFFLFPLITHAESLNQRIVLYTPYTSRSVTPGKTLRYNISVINRTNDIQNIRFSYRGIPSSWSPTLAAAANTIQEISVRPKALGSNSETIQLELTLPLKIKKGIYHFKLIGRTDNGMEYVLPLEVNVTKEGILKTELSVNQANMEGYASSSFDYEINLKNQTGQRQNYALFADAPQGWSVRFRTNGDHVTSVAIKSNKSQTIFVKVSAPPEVKAGKYKIHIHATSGSTSGQATLETVIQGKFGMNLTTPTGRLSTDITAGGKKDIKLLLKNTGTLPLKNVNLTSSAPVDWNVKFDNNKITQLNPGESTIINATVKASSKAIAGDYELQVTANTPNVSSKAMFRITVSQTYTWGFIGVLIILVVIGGIGYLFKKYGRR